MHTSPSILYGTESNNQDNAYNFEPVFSHTKYTIAYNANGGSWATDKQICYADENSGNCVVQGSGINRSGYVFIGWCDGSVFGASCNGKTYQPGNIINAPTGFPSSRLINLTAIWRAPISYKLVYNPNGGTWSDLTSGNKTVTCNESELFAGRCTISSDNITRSGYVFTGWCSGIANANGTCNGTTYAKGTNAYNGVIASRNIPLVAMWKERNETITINASWTSGSDYDSYMKLSKPGESGYQDASWATTNIPVTFNGQTYSLIIGAGDGRGSYNGKYYENFVINTLGGKDYYYSIHNWSSAGYIGNDITVTVSGEYFSSRTFKSTASWSCNYWNVFAYKNGTIVERNTCTSDMEYGY